MTRTKLTSRNNDNNRRIIFRASQAPGVEEEPPPRTGNKNILNSHVRNRIIKTKRILSQFKKVQVKKNSRVIREMNIRQRTRFPSGKGPVEY